MGCGCGGAQPGEQWRAYLPGGTVGEAKSKAAATQEAARTGGYILQVGQPEPAKAS